MGICLGWTQNADIPETAWENICSDFEALAAPYQVEITQRAKENKFPLSFLLGRPPNPAYQVEQASTQKIEVLPSKNALRGIQGLSTHEDLVAFHSWQVSSTQGENWFRQGNHPHSMYHGEMLIAALLLVERHAPGVVLVDQDDYIPGCWTEASEWMARALGGKFNTPKHIRDPREEKKPTPRAPRA